MTRREANADLLAEITALRDRVAALTREKAELQGSVAQVSEQQKATSEILQVISASRSDVQPVFDTIVRSAGSLCEATFSGVALVESDELTLGAAHGLEPGAMAVLRQRYPRPLSRDLATSRAVLERRVIHIPDAQADREYDYPLAGAFVVRTVLAVPMLRAGVPIGAIAVWRDEIRPFTDNQIALLQTFADQAVIAIENVRLFNETKEALERQTATSEILRVISSSPTDTQPVFDIIAANAARLCAARDAQVLRVEGDVLRLVSAYGSPSMPPVRTISRGHGVGRAVIDRRTIHVRDMAQAIAEFPETSAPQHGVESILAVPLLREDVAVGAIRISRTQRQPFTEQQIALLKTFADQAAIAIENVRLFNELQTSNRQLTTALDKQTATSDILRVISRSQTDVQPVFDAIVSSSVRLLRGYFGALTRVVGDQIVLAASTFSTGAEDPAVKAAFPRSIHSESTHAQAIRHRGPVNVGDAQTDPALPEERRAIARARGYRSLVTVPLMHQDETLGTIAVTRREAGGFADDEIVLLQMFADQAVIAIENARLLSELRARTEELTRSIGELTALGEVGQAISTTLDLRTVLSTIVARATQLSGTDAGVIYEYDEHREVFLPRATEHLEAEIVETMLSTPVRKGEGATGRLAEVHEPIQLPDILEAPAESRVRGALVRAGYRGLLAVPLLREEHLIGGLTVFRKTPGEFAHATVDLLRTFATQSALAIQNARLFREVEEKSRQLEVASQHKSEFLANMSHELRTPLNAIIGFSEVLSERMFGELNEKQEEYLKDIHASGQHLLSLINDILDLSKIEAGRMELELSDFDLPTALDNALMLVRERAGRRSIALHTNIDTRLGQIQADERKVRQVVLNLLSNAIKFTPEGGRIEVLAASVDGAVEVSVSDTGVGIAPEDQEAVFEEFRQVGTADKKVEGTGLGLTLCRKFVELHGGRIWVKSEVGVGSTFTFTLPVCCGE